MTTDQNLTKEILSYLKDARSVEEEDDRPKGLDRWVFAIAALIVVAFLAWGIADAEGLGRVASGALSAVIEDFGWLFVIASSVFVLFVLVVAMSRFGRIPLGQDDDTPQYSTWSWISMMFAAGMGIGLMFYGVAEPLFFYASPPPGTVDGESAAAVSVAMGTALFHWTIYPWAMYAIVGLGMAYGTYRLGRTQLFSSMFVGLFGPKAVHGPGGRLINILAIIATLFGSACSLGLGALQIGGGLVHSGVMSQTSSVLLVGIIAVLTTCFIASAISGIERGIQLLSNINMVLAVVLAVLVFIIGPTLFMLNVIPTSLGAFIGNLPEMASRTAASGDETMAEWMSNWTIFYWAWWISWSPFVGLFIGRISRGRTIRQFVTGVLVVPSLVSVLWFAIFGGGSIGVLQRVRDAGQFTNLVERAADGSVSVDSDLVLFQFLESLPMPAWLAVVLVGLCVVLVAIFFVTGADSASIVMAGLAENGAEEPSRWHVVFWGAATGAVAAIMLLAGGDHPDAALEGLKNITIVSALPFVVIMLMLCLSIWRDLRKDPLMLQNQLAREVLEHSVASGIERYDGEVFELTTRSPAVTRDLRRRRNQWPMRVRRQRSRAR
ncbi:BCCT family transporter [Propionimicrobium sp. PCR01-08-3]|uniref:BCCT family transporter n=1 Tax=Propionimicrobium sp. PCR01-08-3 TaxID=3052086 RepID=UPI00255C6C15|nr:BCCT family transporter [Propionimicrobium sp. PCR01-08-3]WIY81845.1 BCCT family transporter [Propionimicrobium sp. PCR01-08-3]